jgi:hypothetical protein|tara:strand:- start:1192 stop:2343 length:1152 start_codon:yes stop_codon:yes gene_type:complete
MALNDEMDAVLASGKADVDPVSGNEVPTGSLPEEVRDDIPAQLSEGEYVVPADVVRFFGVKFFEDIRKKAKKGFDEMEATGRIGGEPAGMEMGNDELPFDVSELQMVDDGEPEMRKGGYVAGYSDGGLNLDSASINAEFPGTQVGVDTGTEEWRVFVNEDGMTLTIRFINGEPVSAIPPGYTENGQKAAEIAAPVSRRSDDDSSSVPPPEPVEDEEWSDASLKDYEDAMAQRDSILDKGLTVGASLISPVLGVAARQAGHNKNYKMMEGLEKKLKGDLPKDERVKLEGFYETLNEDREKVDKDTRSGFIESSGVFGGESNMRENLEDRDGNGVGFGDTWLGDLLGFDEDGVGVQGDNLTDSRAGTRRDGDTSSVETKDDDEDK